MSVSPVSGSTRTATPTGLTPEEATSAWKGVLQKDVAGVMQTKGSTSYIGDSRLERYQKNVQADMEKFLRENPDATKAEIEAFCSKSAAKHRTNEMFGKMRDDNFFSKLMSRRKELLSDMWG